MNSKCLVLITVLAGGLLLSSNAHAQDNPRAPFNPKINTWAEGILMSIDADAGKFSIRGSKKAYATAYARMMQEIETKTAGLTAGERAAKAKDITKAWQDKLVAALKEEPVADGDFSFSLPAQPDTASVYDERSRYGTKGNKDPAEEAQSVLTPSESAAMKTLKDLKVGDPVLVGYESGVIYNTSWILVRVSARMDNQEPGNPNPAQLEAIEQTRLADQQKKDVEITRKIRVAIVDDASLSVAAHNVNIQTQNGSVTLKGQVKTEAEKANVAAKAATIVGERNVISKVDVAGP